MSVKSWLVQGAQCIQGRWVTEEELDWLGDWISLHPEWTRKRLAKELCQLWGWKDARGRLKDFAARSFLLKLDHQGRITLPALRVQMRSRRRPASEPKDWQEPQPRQAALASVRPISVQPVQAGQPEAQRWAFYLSQYHYLGLHVVGENVGYLVQDNQGQDVACLLFGAAAWRCAARDRFFNWDRTQRPEALYRVVNNTRFLILPWVKIPGLASHVLGLIARRIGADWLAKYGHGIQWLETFVERGRFRGTCYRAANWQWLGQTTGRSRQDPHHRMRVAVKDVYVYRLRR